MKAGIETIPTFLSAKDKQEQFYKDLKELLVKYKAELTIENFAIDYGHDYKIVVDFNWDRDLYEIDGNGCGPQLVIGRFEDGK